MTYCIGLLFCKWKTRSKDCENNACFILELVDIFVDKAIAPKTASSSPRMGVCDLTALSWGGVLGYVKLVILTFT